MIISSLPQKNMFDNIEIVKKVMEAVNQSRIKLSSDKCNFGYKKNKFLRVMYCAEGMNTDPAKVDP